MKILLTQDVSSVGRKGSIVDVSPGYAKNFLVKNQFGKVPTNQDLAHIKRQKIQNDQEYQKRIEQYQKWIKVLNDQDIMLWVKTNPEGHLFGSIKAKDIVDEISKSFDLVLQEDMVQLPKQAIRETGKYEITVQLDSHHKTNMNVYVKTETK